MFTGLIEEIGTISEIKKSNSSMVLGITAKKVLENTKLGDSIAVNGVCLTVTRLAKNSFFADVMPQTFELSNLKYLKLNSSVKSVATFGQTWRTYCARACRRHRARSFEDEC